MIVIRVYVKRQKENRNKGKETKERIGKGRENLREKDEGKEGNKAGRKKERISIKNIRI
jgi:hypothetical protein